MKIIAKRFNKTCACCGGNINVISYNDKTYRSGHYFGKIPLHTKKEMRKALKFGTTEKIIDGFKISVLKKDPKPYT